ncbi:hypothetical protein MIMGU_mgv1a006586mg [Erythranthe guttata]|uniref:Sugar phosphate transporter domain-containing protein n=2 Tax=Erythranthe guttata TaxID=4155 RepID=A0A022QG67_ERYGU|nr:hypothetical protein MIMGU_mgv1a006586mg [Erythranthe guttata]
MVEGGGGCGNSGDDDRGKVVTVMWMIMAVAEAVTMAATIGGGANLCLVFLIIFFQVNKTPFTTGHLYADKLQYASTFRRRFRFRFHFAFFCLLIPLGQNPQAAMADRRPKWVKEEFLTYIYILIYIALSSGQIFFNKWVLSSKEINFPYPLGLTLLHMVFSSVLCFVLTKVLKIMKVEEGMTLDIYVSSVLPIGAMFAMTLWLGNTAYLYISVAFAQMLKAIMPVAVFILGVLAGLEVMSCRMLLIMSVISFGVLVASVGEISINWVGVVYQMGGVVGEALRLIFMEIFVKRKGLKLNPISMMYYVSPCSAVCLLLPWIFLEMPRMDAQGTWNFKPLVLTLNSLCTFALNLSVFLVISHTSALTIRVAGVVKDWVVVLLSALLFADTKLTLINLFGYAIAIAGVAAYNNHKLKREASRVNSDNSAESIPLVSTSTSNQ